MNEQDEDKWFQYANHFKKLQTHNELNEYHLFTKGILVDESVRNTISARCHIKNYLISSNIALIPGLWKGLWDLENKILDSMYYDYETTFCI